MEQLLGIDIDKWDGEQEDQLASQSFYAFVDVLGLKMVAEAYRLVEQRAEGDEGEMIQVWDIEAEWRSDAVSEMLDLIAPDAQGWRDNAEHNGGFAFNPVWVEAWEGHFAIVIVSAKADEFVWDEA